MATEHSGNKYHRKIMSVESLSESTTADVYCVLDAFNVTCPGRQHAVKKLLCSGLRGKGDTLQDLKEARDAVDLAIVLEMQRKGKLNEHRLCRHGEVSRKKR